jgi:hypothetical protein
MIPAVSVAARYPEVNARDCVRVDAVQYVKYGVIKMYEDV